MTREEREKKAKIKNEVIIEKQELLRKQELDDLQYVLNTPAGRRFFIRLLEKTGYNSSSFTGNSTTFFNEGKREIALLLLKDISVLGFIGLELKQAAEKEYLSNQLELESLAKQQVKGRYDSY
jgi:hypothetical protein